MSYGEAIERAGLYCGIYSMLSWLQSCLDTPQLDRFDKWVARWSDCCQCRKPYGMWQYTNKLEIDGKIFDGDYAYKDYPAIIKSMG